MNEPTESQGADRKRRRVKIGVLAAGLAVVYIGLCLLTNVVYRDRVLSYFRETGTLTSEQPRNAVGFTSVRFAMSSPFPGVIRTSRHVAYVSMRDLPVTVTRTGYYFCPLGVRRITSHYRCTRGGNPIHYSNLGPDFWD